MSEHTQTTQKRSINKASGHKVPVKDSSIKLPHHDNTTTVFEPTSKVAVLG